MFIVNVEGAVFKEDKWLIIERSKKKITQVACFRLLAVKLNWKEIYQIY